jgi:diacylglycerol kinase (ATP)
MTTERRCGMPKRFIKSFKYARAGAHHAIRTQRNLWIHGAAGLAALLFAAWLGIGQLELALLVLTISAVIVAEMFNTAVEELVNLLSPDQQEQAGLVKNIAAAAVLLAAIGALAVGGVIFIPRLMQ